LISRRREPTLAIVLTLGHLFFANRSARRARLRGAMRTQDIEKRPPRSVEDRAVQPGLLLDVFAGFFGRPFVEAVMF
jgi:hypothetical protein